MKTWVVRFVSLYVFNVVVLWLVGLLIPGVNVGWAAFWASIVLTAATLWLKPFVTKVFMNRATKSASSRTAAGQKLVQYAIVFAIQLIVWILVVLLSGVHVRGLFWGWVLPPVLLLIAWAIYDAIDDRVEAHAGALYDQATGGRKATTDGGGSTPPAVVDPAVRTELDDGLTPEQRRMLDDLGKS